MKTSGFLLLLGLFSIDILNREYAHQGEYHPPYLSVSIICILYPSYVSFPIRRSYVESVPRNNNSYKCLYIMIITMEHLISLVNR